MPALDLTKLAGTSGKGEILVPDAVINRVLAAELDRSTGPVSGATIETLNDDILAIRIALRGPLLLPVPKIVARIDQQPRLPYSTSLGLQWSVPGLGPLGLVAAPILNYLNAMPAGIRAEGDRVRIDIAALADTHGFAQILCHAQRFEVHTRQGAVVLQTEFRIS
jgi:hypothetical protein